ncbi:hypothetical protein [Amycolatopsis tolypomycina]|uniref:Uncharacterized protein n=1 Tax=Amycolatopsis tolypomycina TaxID=208445 RepID=A0A1H4WG05_9PSEU|nr:hypothetical protein [Amycolatopsis tolypomycina]SEC92279.1 hypothetical protein SAMN04489727_5610 [Amycolatopsis tolypomycina]
MTDSERRVAELRTPSRKRALGEVTIGVPTAHPAEPDEPALDAPAGTGLVEIRQQYAWETAGHRARIGAVYLIAGFSDPRVRVHELSGTTAEPATEMVVSELPQGCGWLVGDPLGASAAPRTAEVRATLWVPLDQAELAGVNRLDGTLLRPAWHRRRLHAGTGPVPFSVTLPSGWGQRPVPPPRPVGHRSPAVRLCMAADTVAYGRFTTGEAARSQERLVEVLAKARRAAGIPEDEVDLQPSGDGQFAILPTGLDETVVIPRLVEGVRTALATVNADLSDRARLRLRVALHRGHVAPGANGWVGAVTVAVHRLLDCAPLRARLVQDRSADFALIVSDVLFGDVIVGGDLDAAAFEPVDAVLPDKAFAERAWVHTPQL